jgi:septal ring factor EnvC (AmiA/AmiB activator)
MFFYGCSLLQVASSSSFSSHHPQWQRCLRLGYLTPGPRRLSCCFLQGAMATRAKQAITEIKQGISKAERKVAATEAELRRAQDPDERKLVQQQLAALQQQLAALQQQLAALHQKDLLLMQQQPGAAGLRTWRARGTVTRIRRAEPHTLPWSCA